MKEYTHSQMCCLIDEHIHSERDREIMKRRMCDGVVFERIGWEFSLTDRQVKNIIYKNVALLTKYL